MRIALITDGIWPYVLGGMQKHSYYLCKYLAREKVQVDLFHFNQSPYDITKLEFFSEEELKYISSTVINFPKSYPFPGHYLFNSYRYSKLVFKTLEANLLEYDFIYTKGFTGWYLINKKYKNPGLCAPVGVKFHGYEMFQRPPGLKIKLQHVLLLRKPVRHISRNADLVFSYGGKITDIIKAIGVPVSHIFELPSGVEQDQVVTNIQPAGAKLKFLFLGRYERRKGLEELNQTLRLLIQAGKLTCEFRFIGPIPSNMKINHENLTYYGEIRDREKLQNLMRECDILICPSWSEGMPNVILEAMANGLAVAATDVGATSVLVTPHTGWLLKNSDPLEIQRIIESILEADLAEINQKKQEALNLIKAQFTWEKLILKLYAKLKSLVLKPKD